MSYRPQKSSTSSSSKYKSTSGSHRSTRDPDKSTSSSHRSSRDPDKPTSSSRKSSSYKDPYKPSSSSYGSSGGSYRPSSSSYKPSSSSYHPNSGSHRSSSGPHYPPSRSDNHSYHPTGRPHQPGNYPYPPTSSGPRYPASTPYTPMNSDFVHKFATFSIPDPRLQPPRDGEVIDFLRTCADCWWDKDMLRQHQNAHSHYPFNARSLVNIVMKSSVAADDPGSERIMRFVERFKYHAALDWSALDTKRKTDILYEHFGRLDELFFFGLVTREVDGLTGRAPLVFLETNPDRSSDKLGAFTPTTANIMIWLRSPARDYDFEQLFLTLAHEMTHSFLTIFSDTRHKSHYEWVDQSSGHGKMFWMLLRFLINSIFTFTKSNYFWSQILVSEDEHYDCVIEQHGPSRSRFA